MCNGADVPLSKHDSSNKIVGATVPLTNNQNLHVFVDADDLKRDRLEYWLPLLSAIIVAFFAYKGVIKQSKAQTVSNFRVNWVNEIRTTYSEFQVKLKNVGGKIRSGQLSLKEYHKDEDIENLQFLQTKIKLLLNHNGKTHPEHVKFWGMLLEYINKHHSYYNGPYSEDVENELDQERVQLEELLLVILKNEWDLIKKFN